jgi:translation initiation factor 2B subunit (eIF-2B alpha/beta/delta family)
MNQYTLISSKTSKVISDLKSKAIHASTQYSECRAKILQRSIRLAKEYKYKASSLRERIVASRKKLDQIRKTSGCVRKQTTEISHHRMKHFKETQAAQVLFFASFK